MVIIMINAIIKFMISVCGRAETDLQWLEKNSETSQTFKK